MKKSHYLYQEDLDHILNLEGIDCIRNKRFLITGATGMVGTCLVDALMKFNNEYGAGVSVDVMGRNWERAHTRFGEYFSLPGFHYWEQDARTPFPSMPDFDFIIPLASNTHPVAYSKYPVETIEINVKGAENALKKAKECGATVLYPSTVEVYGNGQEDFTEDYTGHLNLSTARACYTESKRVSEALCQSYLSEFGVVCKIVRLSRLFGPTMMESDTKASSQFILKAIAKEDIVLKSKGQQLFSYTYVADAVQAMLFVLLHGESGQAYNITGCNVRLVDFASECATLAGKSVVFDLPSETEAKGYSFATRAVLSPNKLSSLGWISSYSFKDAIKRTYHILLDE